MFRLFAGKCFKHYFYCYSSLLYLKFKVYKVWHGKNVLYVSYNLFILEILMNPP